MTHSAPATAETAAPFLELSGLRKAYPGVLALDDFSMAVSPGEVIGIVGENGAGKSTLMKILGGVIAPDAGTIAIDGVPRRALGVAESIAAGIAFVHQELNLFDNLDVAANVLIGREPRRGGWLRLVDRERQRAIVAPILARLGASFGTDAPLAGLSLAQRQMVEIAKALSLDARLVILDEPTSSLPASETDKLLGVVAGLKAHGVSVIFITHRLHEVEIVADRVIALRDGRTAGALRKDEIGRDRMVRLMVGRTLAAPEAAPAPAAGAVALRARGVRTSAHPRGGVDLDLRRGEILGLAGLVGSGRSEFARALFGVDPMVSGELEIDGRPFKPRSAADAVAAGVFLVPEDRKSSGVLLDLPVAHNITLPDLRAHSRGFMVSAAMERATAEAQRRSLSIKAPNLATETALLSGGNQQKVVLAKWLAMSPRAMILDEPTRGIDVGAKAEIYRIVRALAASGVAVLMISSDMEEVIGVSHRIAVMHRGTISGILGPEDFGEENILLLAIGAAAKGNRAA
ncbi:MAG: sugar ABC transporter ATP-binding protein [Hyphomicrobiales bacterium]|nr:sugar ABC transporter ATP-binding protein [Hyphomicrobiales bacterium]MDE2017806.1 sugar ABC transporter ATP-binding protein [Hyphomicrobiales bacterium]